MNRTVFVSTLGVMLLIGAFSIACNASTYDTFRCNNGNLVSVNDKIGIVALRCDPPHFCRKEN
jgi:hypothetical protein